MNRDSGVALAVSLILLTVLSLLALCGVRLSSMELRLSRSEELRVAGFQQAQSQLDAALPGVAEVAEGATSTDGGVTVRGLAGTPPPIGTGYSADRFRAAQLRLEAGDETVRISEGLAVIHGVADTGAAPQPAGPDFAEAGVAWSPPRVGAVAIGAGQRVAALFFGGGYDAHKDAPGLGADDSTGNALFVARADTGALIWKAVGPRADGTYASPAGASVFHHDGLRDSVPSGLALLDSDGDGTVDRILAGDTGGNLWRADLAGGIAQWKLTRLACVGRHGGDHCAPLPSSRDDRRFFYAPDIVQLRDPHGRYDAVVIASGDRRHPLATDTDDLVYLIKDREVGLGAGMDRATPAEGWQMSLPGEKTLSAPITMARLIYLASYLPGATAEQGHAWLHVLDLATGAVPVAAIELEQRGLPSQPLYAGSRDAGGASLAAACTARLKVGEQDFDAPACARFRTFWQRIGN